MNERDTWDSVRAVHASFRRAAPVARAATHGFQTRDLCTEIRRSLQVPLYYTCLSGHEGTLMRAYAQCTCTA